MFSQHCCVNQSLFITVYVNQRLLPRKQVISVVQGSNRCYVNQRPVRTLSVTLTLPCCYFCCAGNDLTELQTCSSSSVLILSSHCCLVWIASCWRFSSAARWLSFSDSYHFNINNNEDLHSVNHVITAQSAVHKYILTENKKEKTHTVNIDIQHHPTITVNPSDASTSNPHHQHE